MASIARFFPVTDAEKVIINGEFGKTELDVKEDLELLKEWLKKQKQIPEINNDDLLKHILIRNKFRIAKTKLKIDSYFTSKCVYADYFDTLDPSSEDMVNITNVTFSAFMPKLTLDCERIHVWRMEPTLKLEQYDFKAIIRYASILNETQMVFDYCPKIVSIYDAIGLKMMHLLHMDFVIQAKMLKIYFEAFSGRMSKVHVVNVSPAAEKGMNLMKSILPEKYRFGLDFHSSLESLHKVIPKNLLPLELGGTEQSLVELSGDFARTFRNERAYILNRNRTSTDEKLRIGEPPIQTDMFGVDGTFKKISVD